jgi:hypothetical protein
MNGHSNHLSWFRQAIAREDLEKALKWAQAMHQEGSPITLHDALELLLLMAKKQDKRFKPAAIKWLAAPADRAAVDHGDSDCRCWLDRSPGKATAPRAGLILRDLFCWVGEDPKETQRQRTAARLGLSSPYASELTEKFDFPLAC